MSEAKKIALTLVVILLMTFGVCIGFAQSTPTLTPGFGASGDWAEVVVVTPPPVIPPVKIVTPPVTPPVPPISVPKLGPSGDWGCSSPLQ